LVLPPKIPITAVKKIAVDIGKRYSEVADEVLDLGLKEYAKKYNIDMEKYK